MTSRRFDTPTPDLNGASILVTGGTGSFGRAFVKTVLERYEPARLAVLSRDELKQFEMQQDPAISQKTCMRFFIGDVRDVGRLESAMRDVDIVIHAAALKQITTAEYNPFECVHTNVMGAENIVQAAIRMGVKKVVALSTDKAANPINLYGASKLASDKIFVAGNNMAGSVGTRFAVVRYGNVLGSRGSVVPVFRNLLADGATELPVTDARMTRFWITLQQGVDFVLSSLAMMTGGEIFVPKIPSTTLIDLARALAPDAAHKVIGIRPGEKLHEIMITEDDSRSTVELDDRYVIEPVFSWWDTDPYLDNGASRVEDGFVYASNRNGETLDAEGLIGLLNEAGV
ncbi:MAG: UDP-N-acetylglucosamine 4,6-dehydratase (inverting) [Pseudomonadota bacterium]